MDNISLIAFLVLQGFVTTFMRLKNLSFQAEAKRVTMRDRIAVNPQIHFGKPCMKRQC
jgi:hypothetical protein